MVDEDHDTRLTRSASGEEVIEQFYWLITFFGFD